MAQKPIFPPRLFLSLLILTGVLTLGLRVSALWQTAVHDGPALLAVQPVQAENPAPAAPPAAAPKTETPPAPAVPSKPISMDDTSTLDKDSDLYKQLVGRREQLDKRESDLSAREAMAKVAEQRIDQKVKELETLRTQVQTLLGQASAAQAAQIENLVKIYETMKPKEASRIFETLEMPVLLGVVQKMKPARVAAVLAEMDPQKAKDVTVALTKQDQLPQVKQ